MADTTELTVKVPEGISAGKMMQALRKEMSNKIARAVHFMECRAKRANISKIIGGSRVY